MSHPYCSRALTLGIALLLGACAADRPAPVEYRTTPGTAARTAPQTVPPMPAPPLPPAAPPAVEPPVVQSTPIPPSGVQVRPLPGFNGSATPQSPNGVPPGQAATPGAGAVTGSTAPVSPLPPAGAEIRPSAPIVRQPQGLKRPFSESALAELRAEGAARPVAPPADSTSVPAAKPPEPPRAGAGDPRGTDGRSGDAKGPNAKGADTKAGDAKGDDGKGDDGEFAWPAKGRVIQGFSQPRQMGIQIAGNAGDPVRAAADGRVIFSGPGPRGYGNLLIIKHDRDTLTVYAHNRALLVKDGARVKRGQQVAELGDSGTDRPKLHFEVRRSGKPVDPLTVLPSR